MATIIHNQFGQMTPAQFNALPLQFRLQHSEQLFNEVMINNQPPSGQMLRNLGLRNLNSIQVLHIVHGNLRTSQPEQPTRALNSWMAFRSFYARIFANLQQKDTSGHLTKLWKQDPFKAKWTIVAKAYSRIRDIIGKSNAPLDRFLALACPAIGIIGVEDYLRKMNWSLQAADNGTINLYQTSPPFTATFEPNIMHTSMTDSDVITLVAVEGYISKGVGRAITDIARPPQGLLASAPVFQRHAIPQSTLPPAATFLQSTITAPASSASAGMGVDINDFLNSDPYEWTGSMSDLYNLDAGSIDFLNFANNATAIEWDVSSIHDPLGF